MFLVKVRGIEPPLQRPKRRVIPFHYTKKEELSIKTATKVAVGNCPPLPGFGTVTDSNHLGILVKVKLDNQLASGYGFD